MRDSGGGLSCHLPPVTRHTGGVAGLLPLKCLADNDVADVAPLLQVLLHLKCLMDNDVADVAPFASSTYSWSQPGGGAPLLQIPIPPKTAKNRVTAEYPLSGLVLPSPQQFL